MKNRNNILILLIFTLGVGLFIELNFRFWYAFMEQYMMFQTTQAYFVRHLTEVGGMVEYITELLSMGFYYPMVAAMVIALLTGTISWCFYRYLRSFAGQCSMLAAVAPAFMILIYQQETIAHIISLTVALALSAIYVAIRNSKIRSTIGVVMITVSYFFAAPAHIVFAALIAVYELLASDGNRRYLMTFGSIAWSLLLPLLAMSFIYTIPMREAFLSKHLSHPEAPFPTSLIAMGLAYPLVAIALYLLRDKLFIKRDKLRTRLTFVTLIVALLGCIIFKFDLMAQAYRYDFYARNAEWQKITDHYHRNGVSDLDALIYVNLAASYTSTMTTDFTYTPQFGLDGIYPREGKFYIQNVLASEVAWRIGHVNTAQRTAFIGTLGSRRSVQPRMMKRLVETYIVTGEYAVAEKFIKILESYPPYSAWATAQRPLLDPATAASTEWVKQKRALAPTTDNRYDLQLAFPMAVESLLSDHPENRAAAEYLLTFYLSYKDLQNALPILSTMKGQSLPKLYQEVICVMVAAGAISQAEADEYNISPEIWQRFNNFASNMQMLTPDTARQMYGDTYYYYLQFMPTPEL